MTKGAATKAKGIGEKATGRSASPATKAPALAIAVEAGEWPRRSELVALTRRAVRAALGKEVSLSAGSELSLVFTDDAHMRSLNRQWRRKDRPTNVLSFPGSPSKKGEFGPILGDIVLAFETIDREAREMTLTLSDHLTHLIIHGILHLLGHDHQTDDEAEAMEGRERVILAGLGIADPYGASR